MLQRFDERNRDLKVWINGKLGHRDEIGVSPFDSLVQGGDGVWEGLRLYDGRIFKLREHLARLRASAEALSFAVIPRDEAIISAIRATLAANHMRDGVHIRLTLSRGLKYTSGMDPRLNDRGPTLIVLAEWKPPVYDKGGLRLITARTRRIPPQCLDQKIHSNNLLNSILAKIEANAAGADDALMLDLEGNLAETNATHVFIVSGGGLRTSRTDSCPEGITRATVLELAARAGITAEVGAVTPAELLAADEMFCTGTMGELAAVTELDGRTVGTGRCGPVTSRLSELYAELTRTTGEKVVD